MTGPLPDASLAISKLRAAKGVDLYLDYDGTLAPFAPTPDDVLPNSKVIELISSLGRQPRLRVAIVSGRRLAHIQKLLPVEGILLAGTYGVEMRTPDGKEIHRIPYDAIRPTLDSLKPRWAALLDGKAGFYLEDKGWALAIHARKAEESLGEQVLESAERMLTPQILGEHFRIIHSYRFLEIGPNLADKGQALRYLFQESPHPDWLPIYIGDDDKDEEAFQAVKGRGGVPILVTTESRQTLAEYCLSSPAEVHNWLKTTFLKTRS